MQHNYFDAQWFFGVRLSNTPKKIIIIINEEAKVSIETCKLDTTTRSSTTINIGLEFHTWIEFVFVPMRKFVSFLPCFFFSSLLMAYVLVYLFIYLFKCHVCDVEARDADVLTIQKYECNI